MFEILKIIRKRIKLRTLIILILLLIFNTYAWFIFTTRVSTSLSAHVVAWNVQFEAGDTDSTEDINFTVGRAYPGMDDEVQTVKVSNNGEMSANLIYEIKSVTILGETYTESDTVTSNDLLNMIQNDYPFSINITTDKTTLDSNGDTGNFTITFTWPYESDTTNDTVDTSWGEKAYEYYAKDSNTPSIQIEIELTATQQAG